MLKTLLLRQKILRLEELRTSLNERDEDLKKRENEVETSLNEATEEKISEDDLKELENIVEKLTDERKSLDEEIAKTDESLDTLRSELEEVEKEQARTISKEIKTRTLKKEKEDKGVNMMLDTRNVFEQEEVRTWLGSIKEIIGGKRSIANADLTIPDVVLPLITDNLAKASQLYSKVNVRKLKGNGRERILGVTPPAFWMEMYGEDDIKELTLGFTKIEVDGFMVAAILSVPNALLEDNDVSLGSIIVDSLAKSIAKALDHAIVYGKGKEAKQPLGILSGVKEENKIKIDNKHGKELFAEIVSATGKLNKDYATGPITWMMNQATYTKLVVEALGFNANGAIVSGVNKVMPVVGGEIVILNFMKDNEILGGYADLYLLADRADVKLEKSDQVLFISNQTVFKGTARYDGVLVFEDAFVALMLGNEEFTAVDNQEQKDVAESKKKQNEEIEKVKKADETKNKKKD